MRKESFGWTLKLTELYRFSSQKIYPGRGIIFIRSDSQVFLFLNSKCKRYFHNKLKHLSFHGLLCTESSTRTQLAHRLMKKHLNRIIDESFPSNVDNGGDSQDKIGVRSKKQSLRTTYMNVLLGLIETLCQLPVDLSDDDLDEASIAVSYVAKAGLKVDWLETKLEEVKEKKEKIDTGKARLQQMKEELHKFNQKCLDLKALMEKDNADLSTANVPLSFDDVV